MKYFGNYGPHRTLKFDKDLSHCQNNLNFTLSKVFVKSSNFITFDTVNNFIAFDNVGSSFTKCQVIFPVALAW